MTDELEGIVIEVYADGSQCANCSHLEHCPSGCRVIDGDESLDSCPGIDQHIEQLQTALVEIKAVVNSRDFYGLKRAIKKILEEQCSTTTS